MERVETQAALIPVEVVYQNLVEETDPEEGWKAEANFFGNAPKGEGLHSGVVDQGLLVLGAVFAAGVGGYAPLVAAGQLKAMFPKNLILIKNGFKVKIGREPYIGAPLETDTKFRVPVTVEWTC